MQHDFDELVDRRGTDSKKWKDCGVVTPMWLGDTDFKAPGPVVDALVRRSEHGVFGYPAEDAGLRKAFVQWLATRHGWTVDERAVLPVSGAIGALGQSILAMTRPGDAVVVLSPYYPTFRTIIEATGRKCLECRLRIDEGRCAVDLAALEASLAPDSSTLLLLCNPHNPTGKVFSREELSAIVDLCSKHRAGILADEVHADVLRPGVKHIPVSTLTRGAAVDVVTLIDSNKAFNLGGLRASAAIVEDPDLRSDLESRLKTCGLHKINVFAITALQVSYAECSWYVDGLNAYIEENRALVETAFPLDDEHIAAIRATGTYLVWLDCRPLLTRIVDLHRFFLEVARVDLAAGADFGSGWNGFMRLNIAVPRPLLLSVISRIKDSLLRVPSVDPRS